MPSSWIGCLAIPYIVPLLRVTLGPLLRTYYPSRKFLGSLCRGAARCEYVIYPFRQTLFTLTLWILLIAALLQTAPNVHHVAFLAVLCFFDISCRRHKRDTDVRMGGFLRHNVNPHPALFYTAYKMLLAWGTLPPEQIARSDCINPVAVDFRKGLRTTQGIGPLLKIIFDTAYISFICINSLKAVGPVFASEVFDHASPVWGTRTLELFRSRFTVIGAEKLHGRHGKFLFVFNHKSSLDFMLGFLALSAVRINDRLAKLRYIIAKDHFKDNWIVYSLFGVGRVCEAVGMVFIERKKREKGFENLRQAAHQLVNTDIDLAIYPQGTRANVLLDRAGKRRDAGYYTTITRKDVASPLAHLRKGTAHLIANTLEELQTKGSDDQLHVVFMGIKGTATALPNNTVKVQSESDIEYTLGDIVTLTRHTWQEFIPVSSTEEEHATGFARLIDELNAMVHDRLKSCLNVHDAIAQRFLADLKGYFRYDEHKIDEIAQALFLKAEEGDTVFALIDRIHALPVARWNGYLSELSQYLQDKAPPQRYEKMLVEVSQELVGIKPS